VAGSLVVRLVHRGAYYPGFDVVGAANGLFLWSTQSKWDAIATVFVHSRTYSAPFPFYSALCALLPGFLASVWPWEHWGGVVTFGVCVVTLWLVARATDLRREDAWVLLLAWSASSALLSFSVTGFGWATAFLPHALALFVVLDARLQRRAVPTLALALLATELSWHVYELGKTVFVVFILAALILRAVPWRARLVWLGVAGLQLWMIHRFPSSHVIAYTQLHHVAPAEMIDRLAAVARMLVVSPYLDLPVLFLAAVVSSIGSSRRSALIGILLLVQLGLVEVLALRSPGDVRPRRFLMVDWYCLTLIASRLADLRCATGYRRWLRTTVIGLLVAGSVWQMADLTRFALQPIDELRWQGWAFTMPFVDSQIDYMTALDDADWSTELRRRADAGETLLLIYDLGAYPENITNPSASLERLYLHLGHERFRRSVFAFGSAPCHHSCIPIHPMSELEPFLESVARGTGPPINTITGYWPVEHVYDKPAFVEDRKRALDAIRARFLMTVETGPNERYQRFRISVRQGDAPAGDTRNPAS
jgi:hypothetical protein